MLGSFCLFGALFWLFIKFLPTVSVTEVKEHLALEQEEEGHE
jgi:hypothetical protein